MNDPGGGGFKVSPGELTAAASTLEQQGSELATALGGLLRGIAVDTGNAALDQLIAAKVTDAGAAFSQAGQALLIDSSRFATCAKSYQASVDRNVEVIQETLRVVVGQL